MKSDKNGKFNSKHKFTMKKLDLSKIKNRVIMLGVPASIFAIFCLIGVTISFFDLETFSRYVDATAAIAFIFMILMFVGLTIVLRFDSKQRKKKIWTIK